MANVPTNRHQLDLIEALAKTPRKRIPIRWSGIGLFRPSLYDWRLSYISLGQYRSGKIDLIGQLEAVKPEIIIRNYRIPGWSTIMASNGLPSTMWRCRLNYSSWGLFHTMAKTVVLDCPACPI